MKQFISLSRNIRRSILDMVYKTKSPHVGSSFSAVELLVALYFNTLLTSPADPHNPDRDRFVLSKGHASPALYAILAERGFLSRAYLEGFAVDNGLLEQHPSRDVIRGIEVSSGSLGHGLSIGAGMALAAKNDRRRYKVYVLLGDGELNEGSIWEAAMFASHHGLDNLVAIVDYNKIQALGHSEDIVNLEPMSQRWQSFGWEVQQIDGHDFEQIFGAFGSIPFAINKPSLVIAHTVKGKGVSFMENQLLWHYRAPNDEEYEAAMREITGERIVL